MAHGFSISYLYYLQLEFVLCWQRFHPFFLINPFAPNAPFLKNLKVFILKNFVFIVKKNLKFCFLKFFCFIISLTFYTPFSLSLWLTHLFLVHPFSTPPENIRKSYGFSMFSGVRERVHWEQMG